MVPTDVLVASNAAAVLAAVVAVPQVVAAARRPAALSHVPHASLALQVAAMSLFAYVDVRLGMVAAAAQTAGGAGCAAFVWAMKLRARPPRGLRAVPSRRGSDGGRGSFSGERRASRT